MSKKLKKEDILLEFRKSQQEAVEKFKLSVSENVEPLRELQGEKWNEYLNLEKKINDELNKYRDEYFHTREKARQLCISSLRKAGVRKPAHTADFLLRD